MKTISCPSNSRVARRSLLVAALVSTALAGLLLAGPGGGSGVAGPESASACGVLPISVEVRSKWGKPYARQYKEKAAIALTNRGGYRIGGLLAQIYTFGGFRLGGSGALGSLGPGRTRTIVVDLDVPMQPGKVSVVVKGANKGCDTDQISHVVKFHPCQTRLPLEFPSRPGGFASDYSDFVSVPARPRGGNVIRHLRSRIFTFDGTLVGHDVNRHRVVYGAVRLDNRLNRRLQRGRYTMLARGWLNQPRSCGPKFAQIVLGFK